MQVRACFGMDGDDVGSGIGEGFDIGIDRCDHQVNVKHLVAMRAQCLDHIRADGDVGHVMTIHDIDMDVVCASGINRADVNTQLGEIGGKDRRCDFNGV